MPDNPAAAPPASDAPAPPRETVSCPECGEPCEDAHPAEWGSWRDAAGVMQRVHKWCAEAWSAKQKRVAGRFPGTSPRYVCRECGEVMRPYPEIPGDYVCVNERCEWCRFPIAPLLLDAASPAQEATPPREQFNASAPRGSCPYGWCGDGTKGCRRPECVAHGAAPTPEASAPEPYTGAFCEHCGWKLPELTELRATVAALTAERTRDSARLDWLQSTASNEFDLAGEFHRGSDLRVAIDDAMSQQD